MIRMAKGKFQSKPKGNPVMLTGCLCTLIVLLVLIGAVCLLLKYDPNNEPALQQTGTSQMQTNTTSPDAVIPTQTTAAPTEVTTQPTEETTEPTEEATEPTEEATEPTEEETLPEEEQLTFGQAVADLARAQEGAPYLHGGASPEGFDTSGLVYYCLKENGATASRLVSGLAAGGQPVEKDQLLPGDVVFFWTENEGQPEYVGIYLGEGKFIAARHGDNPATVMDLTTNYFSQRFVCARRYEPENKD